MEVRIDDLQDLIDLLSAKGFSIYGPIRKDGAIVYDSISSAQDFPRGWIDEQSPGKFRLEQKGKSFFAFTLGHDSWKKFLLPPRQKLWSAEMKKGKLKIIPEAEPQEKMAFFGVRSCELRAISVQDKVLGKDVDSFYAARRENTFLIAVQCVRSSGACFCISQGTGPKAEKGFDLAITEVYGPGEHYFLMESGSVKGKKILDQLPQKKASSVEVQAGKKARQGAVDTQTKKMAPGQEVRQALFGSLESKRWDEIATRCVSCANCTLVCPTCFCTTVEEVTDLTGDHAERWRRWDSCFTTDFSYMHGGAVRSSTRSKYRQWMTHKLSTWWDQFGSSGCVGCGRCTTWCPVGIDLAEEANNFSLDHQKNQIKESTL